MHRQERLESPDASVGEQGRDAAKPVNGGIKVLVLGPVRQ